VFVSISRVTDYQPFTIRSHLGDVLKSGDSFVGYDLQHISAMNDELQDKKIQNDAILIRKKKETKRMYKLKRIDIEKLEKKKKQNKPDD